MSDKSFISKLIETIDTKHRFVPGTRINTQPLILACTYLSDNDKVDGMNIDEVMAKLLDKYDVNFQDSHYRTALGQAIQNDSNDRIVEILLKAGANPNRPVTIEGYRVGFVVPISYCSKSFQIRKVELLFDAGADIHDNSLIVVMANKIRSMEQMIKTQQEEIASLKEEMDVMKYAPGGPMFKEAEDHFNSMV